MSLLKVDTVQGRSGTDISVASGHTLKDASGNAIEAQQDFDLWRYTSNVTSDQVFKTDWERPDGGTGLDGKYIGSGMSVDTSTGYWTFPRTGLWQVTFYFNCDVRSNSYAYLSIIATDDNGSNEEDVTQAYENERDGAGGRGLNGAMTCLLNITDTSNHKVKVASSNGWDSTNHIFGSSVKNITYIVCERKGVGQSG